MPGDREPAEERSDEEGRPYADKACYGDIEALRLELCELRKDLLVAIKTPKRAAQTPEEKQKAFLKRKAKIGALCAAWDELARELDLAPAEASNQTRILYCQKRLNEGILARFDEVAAAIRESGFHRGVNDHTWQITFGWLIEKDNWLKLLEGRKRNKRQHSAVAVSQRPPKRKPRVWVLNGAGCSHEIHQGDFRVTWGISATCGEHLCPPFREVKPGQGGQFCVECNRLGQEEVKKLMEGKPCR